MDEFDISTNANYEEESEVDRLFDNEIISEITQDYQDNVIEEMDEIENIDNIEEFDQESINYN